ncbi:MAG: hypothetical protein SFW35_08470 [Chitinophagales bacterium]|nr:hypothetical protein [Chitinophagales bacterium]
MGSSAEFRLRTDIDLKQWDTFIETYSDLPYALSWYLDSTASNNWGALIAEDHKWVLPLPFHTKFGISYVYQPFFTQQLGLFASTGIVEMERALAAIPKKFRLVDIYCNYTNAVVERNQLAARTNLVLPLNKSYSELRSAFTENLKRNIKKATKAGLIFLETGDYKSAVDFFKLHVSNRIENLPDKAFIKLAILCNALQERKKLRSYRVVSPKGTVLASAIFIEHHNRLINILPSSNEEGRANGAMAFLLDSIIKNNADSDTILDFEGSMIPGVAQFYQSFGALNQPYWHLKINRLPWPLKYFK